MNDCKNISQLLDVYGVRNTVLENFHAGVSPSTKTGDYTDVKVVTPYGEIPWNELSRINDIEMRSLMLDIEAALTTALEALELLDEFCSKEKATISFLTNGEKIRDVLYAGVLAKRSWDVTEQKITPEAAAMLTLYNKALCLAQERVKIGKSFIVENPSVKETSS
jgi:O-acetylhomoserine/O-acetylserine sulfhydrylase-like pyridoxal-dependent enzyme